MRSGAENYLAAVVLQQAGFFTFMFNLGGENYSLIVLPKQLMLALLDPAPPD